MECFVWVWVADMINYNNTDMGSWDDSDLSVQ